MLRHLVLPFVLALLTIAPAHAASVIEVMHPWTRPTIPNRPGVVYFGIHNLGDTPDRLIGARSPGIGKIEVHKAEQMNSVMMMTKVDAVDIPAGGMAHLEPGGLHLMMFDLSQPLKVGEDIEITLIFEIAGEVSINVPITKTMDDQKHQGAGHQHGTQHQHSTTGN